MDIAGCASLIRVAASVRLDRAGWPLVSIPGRPIVSAASRASFDAPLVRSDAISWTASSTTGGSTLHPLVIRCQSGDAHPDPAFQEVPRVPFRGAARHHVEFSKDCF